MTFVIVGDVRRVSVDALDALPNVRFLGPQPYETMPAYLRRFDVALVPFEVSPVTDGMDVVKLYEYLSQGKPIVTTPIREIVPYGDLLYLATSPDEFVAQLDRALAEDDPALVARRIELARQHSWDERLDRIDAQIRRHLSPTAPRSAGRVDRARAAVGRGRAGPLAGRHRPPQPRAGGRPPLPGLEGRQPRLAGPRPGRRRREAGPATAPT